MVKDIVDRPNLKTHSGASGAKLGKTLFRFCLPPVNLIRKTRIVSPYILQGSQSHDSHKRLSWDEA